MGIADMLIAGIIIAGAVALLYHSVWKKRGHCHGCNDGGCSATKK